MRAHTSVPRIQRAMFLPKTESSRLAWPHRRGMEVKLQRQDHQRVAKALDRRSRLSISGSHGGCRAREPILWTCALMVAWHLQCAVRNCSCFPVRGGPSSRVLTMHMGKQRQKTGDEGNRQKVPNVIP